MMCAPERAKQTVSANSMVTGSKQSNSETGRLPACAPHADRVCSRDPQVCQQCGARQKVAMVSLF